MKINLIYKIYVGHKCVYIDYTQDNLINALRLHFMGNNHKQHIDVDMVSKVEYATVKSLADAIVQTAYLVNRDKPLYNKSGKSRDELSEDIILPELHFVEFNDPTLDKWKLLKKTEQFSLFNQ